MEKLNFLIVDDSNYTQKKLKNIITKLGHDAFGFASSGDEAIEIYKNNRDYIDIISLDLNMPDKDGIQTFSELKEFDRNVSVIILTAQESKKNQVIRTGHIPLDFIKKPVFPEQFDISIQKYLKIKHNKFNLMIVDEIAMIRKKISQAVKKYGFKIIADCANGLDAVKKFTENSHKIDVVLIDINLPDVDSDEVISTLKQIKPEIKIILTATKNHTNMISKSINVGVNDILVKPFEDKRIKESIRKVMSSI